MYRLTGQHFDDSRSNRPDVGLETVVALFDHPEAAKLSFLSKDLGTERHANQTHSGAIQYGVPFIDLIESSSKEFWFLCSLLEQPKSINLTIPLGMTMMFLPLMSLMKQRDRVGPRAP